MIKKILNTFGATPIVGTIGLIVLALSADHIKTEFARFEAKKLAADELAKTQKEGAR